MKHKVSWLKFEFDWCQSEWKAKDFFTTRLGQNSLCIHASEKVKMNDGDLIKEKVLH